MQNNDMREKSSSRTRSIIIVTILLVITLCMSIAFAIVDVKAGIEEFCFARIQDAGEYFREDINIRVRGDTQHLHVIAELVETYAEVDSEDTRQLLSTFDSYGIFYTIEILLPDGRTITNKGEYGKPPTWVDYESLAAKGQHISERYMSTATGRQFLLSVMPIERDGNTEALVLGVIDLRKFPEYFRSDVFEGKSYLYIVEGKSGNFIMDTWHVKLNNLDDYNGRTVRERYSEEKMREDFVNGEAGYFEFKSRGSKDFMDVYYMPVGINDWMLAISVPESVSFQYVANIQNSLWDKFILLAILLCIYFMALLTIAKRDRKGKEKEIDRLGYMLEIEKTLFNVHTRPEHVKKALKVATFAMKAHRTHLLLKNNEAIEKYYDPVQGHEAGITIFDEETIEKHIPGVYAELKKEPFIIREKEELMEMNIPKEFEGIGHEIPENIVVARIKDSRGRILGVLIAINVMNPQKDAEVLEGIAMTFAMALVNIESHYLIRELGMTDQLTGMANRHSFELRMEEYRDENPGLLGYVYIDADGLHALNTQGGHEAGDKMLCHIADAIRAEFGSDDSFRIGGDEFLALTELDQSEVEAKVERMTKVIKEAGYSISVGIQYQRAGEDSTEVLKEAERKMYEAKYQFYLEKRNGQGTQPDVDTSQKSEKVELANIPKTDANIFISVMDANFAAAYIVNLTDDTAREIYTSEDLDSAITRRKGKFSEAMKLYVGSQVTSEHQRTFDAMYDYDWLDGQLQNDAKPKLFYQKLDGEWIGLKIRKSPNYANDKKETVWLFEKVSK